ncbi:MAG: murein biosynthesis integral membrane protein MurJ [Sandaracinus sp.]|nr:murein biosynthesis integral membrane protein MurJ [Sandaracinus sp.]MCB9634279.1 murein biosynthesis integral membrane protein MurJ [Sandaracinus sp.]
MKQDHDSGAERRQLARRAGLVAAGTLASRILGAARDAVIAAFFTVAATDAFWLAFTIPNALRGLLGEGAVSAAFVPVLTNVRDREGPEAAQRYYARLQGVMLLVLGGVSLLGVLGAPMLVDAYASGFRDDPALRETTITLTRWVFPYIAFMGVAALLTGALHAHGQFLAPAFAPIWLNVALVAAAVSLPSALTAAGHDPVLALAIGALVGGALQVLAQLRAYRKLGYPIVPRFSLDPHVKRSLALLVPLLAGLGVYQLNLVLSRQLASYLPTGALSYLFYAQRLVEIPQGMFALAIGTASLPALAGLASRGDVDGAKRLFRDGLRLSLFVAVPSSVLLGVLAEPTVAAILGRGRFGAEQIHETTRALVALAAGIWAVASVRTCVPMFHAFGETRTPVLASLLNLIVFVSLGVWLAEPLGHAGIAVAISVASTVQLFALVGLLRRKVGPLGLREIALSASRTLVASAAMGAVAWPFRSLVDWGAGGTLVATLTFTGAGIASGVTFVVVAYVLRSSELRDVLGALRRRVKR